MMLSHLREILRFASLSTRKNGFLTQIFVSESVYSYINIFK